MSAVTPFVQPKKDFRRLYVFGCGGSGREVAWLAEQAWGDAIEIVFLVDQRQYLREPVNGHRVLLLSEADCSDEARFVVALGNPLLRRKAAAACAHAGHRAATLIHPRVEMSHWLTIGEGTVICAASVLTTNVKVGVHVQINLGCTISHDVRVGDFSTLSPGVHVSGHVHIGDGVFIGTSACIINGSAEAPLTIGDGAVIAAGACVTKDVTPHTLVAGVPAVRKR